MRVPMVADAARLRARRPGTGLPRAFEAAQGQDTERHRTMKATRFAASANRRGGA
jgi:hypothetical protein